MQQITISEPHRYQPRVASTGLEAAVVHRRFLWITDYEYCNLIDISLGGIGIASKLMDLRVGKKLELEIYHQLETFEIRCVVLHKSFRQGKHHYGLAFVDAPPDLDRLIAMFLKSRQEKSGDRKMDGKLSKRQVGSHRIKIDAQIYIRNPATENASVLCKVENVSRGGLAFSCNHRLSDHTPFEIEARISDDARAVPLAGRVVHMQKRSDRYHYGTVLRHMPEEMIKLIEVLERQ